MIEWPFLLMAGLLGSSHCLGMCGGFALAIGSGSTHGWANLRRQLTYTMGRVFSYATLGALAGYGGWRLAQFAPWGVQLSALLAVIAGLILVYQGAIASGWLKRNAASGPAAGCPGPSLFAAMFQVPGPWRPLLAGIFTGFLPCGLLYGMLALAASTHHWRSGLIAMTLFGLGTAPLMIATGLGGSLLSLAGRRRLWTVAAWSLVIAGTVSVTRGALVLLNPQAPCALCPPAHGRP